MIYGQSEEDFFCLASMPRNRELMRVFKDVGLVEQLDSGMSRILKEYEKSIFSISPRSIKVVFPYSEELDAEGKVNSKGTVKLNSTQQRIVEMMKGNPEITISELSEAFGMSHSGIKKNIAKLKSLEMIERIGSDKMGFWKVNE